jgi:tryptophan halogenase
MSSNSLGVNVAVTGRLPKRIVIVGNNESAWMAAACLSMQIRQLGCRITVVADGPPVSEFVGESSTPSLHGLLSNLRIDEHEMMRMTEGTYRLATQFSDWVQNERDFWTPVAPLNGRQDAAAIFPDWFSERSQGRLLRPFHSYSLHWGAALAGKGPYGFSGPSQISKTGAYSFHLNGAHFAAWLRSVALAHETEEISGEISSINTNGRGGIAQVKLATGAIVASDFFIDCTGSESRLMRGTLKDEFHGNDFPSCDRTISVQLPGRRQVSPFTRVTGLAAGYAWQSPLARTVNAGYAFSTQFADDDSALGQLQNLLSMDGLLPKSADSESLQLRPEFVSRQLGRQTHFWRDNVLALGTAAGVLDPLISASRHLTQLAIESFIELFPERQANRTAVNYFNERITRAFDELQEFAQLHYVLSKRTDTDFWKATKSSTSASLDQKVALYAASGSVGTLAPEAVGQSSYWSLLAGCGRLPAKPTLLSKAADPASVQQSLRDILKSNELALKDLPLHEELLDWIHMDGGMLKSA